MTAQAIASVIRQVFAVAAVVMGALTQALQGIHLPPALSAVLAAGGLLLLNLEHYLGDTSTGNPTTTTITSTTTPANTPLAVAVPVAPVAPVAPVVAPVAAGPCQGTAVPTVPVVAT